MTVSSGGGTSSERFDVVVVGSGFAGSLVAWGLQRLGLRVALIERGRHPRAALGESSTPLGNLALERLARRLDSEALWNLATFGRWQRSHPDLRCGLKRGFSFYRHQAGKVFHPGCGDRARLVVAASPDDEVADLQWWRSDVDAALVSWASQGGVTFLDGVELHELDRLEVGFALRGRRTPSGDVMKHAAEPIALRADFLIDATGGAGFLSRALELGPGRRTGTFSTRLLAGHFTGVTPWEEQLSSAGEASPYCESWGAVHHLLDRGWMYQLRLQGDLLSAGFVLPRQERSGRGRTQSPTQEFAALLRRYPSLGRQFAAAQRQGAWFETERLPFRAAKSVGRDWLLMPQSYAFFDPLYSTGIAWSLVAVERILDLFASGRPESSMLDRYGAVLAAEADHIDQLVDLSYRALDLEAEGGLDLFTLTSRIYFVAASFSESAQRLLDQPAVGMEDVAWWWQGLLGATDPQLRAAIEGWQLTLRELDGRPRIGELAVLLENLLVERDMAGLLDDPLRRIVPVRLQAMIGASARLGLSSEEMRRRLPRLRSSEWANSVH